MNLGDYPTLHFGHEIKQRQSAVIAVLHFTVTEQVFHAYSGREKLTVLYCSTFLAG
jgi:hypothetical protein